MDAMSLAEKLSKRVKGSTPKDIGEHRWSEKNNSAVFTTWSPRRAQKVVVVVSIFEDNTVALAFFSSESLSEIDKYENITHLNYDSPKDYVEMGKDIRWVWKTVDYSAASWDR